MIEQVKLLKSFLNHFFSRYQIGLEVSMKDSDFLFDYVDLLHYKRHKINQNYGESYINSPNWIKNKQP